MHTGAIPAAQSPLHHPRTASVSHRPLTDTTSQGYACGVGRKGKHRRYSHYIYSCLQLVYKWLLLLFPKVRDSVISRPEGQALKR